jgi:hypothetical protein
MKEKLKVASRHQDDIKAEPLDYSLAPPIAYWSVALPLGPTQLHVTRRDQSLHRTPPTVPHDQSPYGILGSPHVFQQKYERWPSDTETAESALPSENTTENVVDEDHDRSKLKGVFWPGMSLFDSATEDQKRKRNQRKDDSVVKQMEQTSADVEPTEFVWTEDGDFQRTRDIYASPSIDGSPVSEILRMKCEKLCQADKIWE